MKKMKKRRELDALVNGKTSTGHRKKTKGQHELLRDNSESSDIEEFSIPDQTIVRKRTTSSRVCATCLMGCGFFLLMACLVAVTGLVWVHVELKRDVDALQANLRRLEMGSANTPDQFQQLHTAQQQLQEKLGELEKSYSQFDMMQQNVAKALQQIKELNDTTKSLSKRLATTSAVENLPDTLNSLQHSMADSTSNIQSLRNNVDALTNKYNTYSVTVDDLKARLHTMSPDDVPLPAGKNRKVEMQDSHEDSTPFIDVADTLDDSQSVAITAVNRSIHQEIEEMMKQQELLGEVQNASRLLDSRMGLLEVAQFAAARQISNVSSPDMHALVSQAVSSVMEELRNASIDSGAEAVSGLADRLDVLARDVENTTRLDTLADKQKLIVQQVTVLQHSLSTVANTVTANEQRITLVEGVEHADHGGEGREVGNGDAQTADVDETLQQPGDDTGEGAGEGGDTGSVEDAEKQVTGNENEFRQTTLPSTNASSENVTEAVEVKLTTTGPNPNATVSVPWINNQEDCRINFYRWDQDGDEHVLYAELSDFMGPYLPAEQLFKAYDLNGDARYDLDEMLAAFGYPPYVAPKLEFEDELDTSNTTHTMEFARPPAAVQQRNKNLPFSAAAAKDPPAPPAQPQEPTGADQLFDEE